MAASRALIARIQSDAASPDYWYVPKGKSIDSKNWPLIADHLRILDKFRTVPWSQAQPLYVAELLKEGFVDPYKDHKEGFSGVGRMQIPVWRILGLAWVNQKGVPEVTEVGKAFIAAKTEGVRRELLSTQVHRYQFWNPSSHAHFSSFQTFPMLGLYKLLQQTDWHLDWDEFHLFGTRTRSFNDADDLVDLIEDWRTLSAKEKTALLNLAKTIPASSHTKNEEGTTWHKIMGDINYIQSMLELSPFLELTQAGVAIPKPSRRNARAVVKAASATAEVIEYESEQDWQAQYGQLTEKSRMDSPWTTNSDAKAYYERIGKIDAAAAAFAKEDKRRSTGAVKQYRQVQIRESILEDLLEQDLEALEEGLKFKNRQYATAVGPIDILATDKDDLLVVIELKRGRTSDKVVGQIARYISWVVERLAEGKRDKVRGIVVGTHFDKHFDAAIKQIHDVTPYTFDLQIYYEKWLPEAVVVAKRAVKSARV